MSLGEHESLLSERPVGMLVVEMNIEYLSAAETYFERLAKKSTPFKSDYVLGINCAKKQIRRCFDNGEPYDFVFTALDLGEKHGGFEVIREALIYGTLGFLISDIAYKDIISPYFKPNTKIDVLRESHMIKERRDSSQTWEEIALYATTSYIHKKGKKLLERIADEEDFPIKRDSNIVKQVIEQYVDSSLSRISDEWNDAGKGRN